MANFSAGTAELNVVPSVTSGFASILSSKLSGPIEAEGKKISAALGKSITLGKAAAVAGFAAIGAAAIHGMSAAVSATEDFGHSVLILQRQLGGTAEEASKLVVVGEHLGISVDTMSRGFGLFSKNLVNNSTQIQHYGLSLKDADGNTKSFTTVLGEAADKYNSLGSAIEKTAFVQNVFGKGGKEMIPILQLGSKGLAEIGAEAKKYGLILTQGNVEAIHKFALAQNDANLASQGLKVSLGTQLIPVLTLFERGLTLGLEVLNHIPGPIKAVGIAAIGLTAILAATGIVVGIVRTGLGNLGISYTSLTGAIEAKTAATIEDIAAEQVGILTAQGETASELESAGALGVHAAAARADALALKGDGAAAVLASRSLLGLGVAGAEGGAVASAGLLGIASAAGVAALAIIPVAAAFLIERGAVTAASRAYFAHTAAVQANTDAAKDDSGVYSHLLGQYAKNRSVLDENTGATQALTAAQNTLDTGVQNLTRDFYAGATAALAQRDAMLGLEGGLLGVVDSFRGLADADSAVSVAEKAVAEDIAKGRKGTQQYRDDLKALSDAEYADVHATFSLKQSIAAYGDQLLGPVKTAQDAVASSLANLAKVQGDAKASAVDLQDAQNGVTDAQDALAAAEKGLAPEQQKAISQLDAMARKAGFSKAEIATLNDKILGYIGTVKGIPKAATTKVTAPGLPGVLSQFESLYGTIYKIKSLGSIFIPVGGGSGRGSKGGVFKGYAAGAMFASPGGHLFQAGEGNYPTPMGKGGEIVNEKGVMPLDERGRRAILEAAGISGFSADHIGAAVAREIWPMIRALANRPISIQVNRREIALAVSDQGLAER